MNTDATMARGDLLLQVPAAILLVLCFVCGGDSAHGNLGTWIAQLIAVPLLVVALVQCVRNDRLSRSRWAVAAVGMIVVLPALQLLPLPTWLWTLPTGRETLLRDLHQVGVATVDKRWSLAPAATERDLYFLLPGLALFFCMLGLDSRAWRRMLGLIVVLCVANLALAFAQVAAGQNSILNPYPEFAPAMAGIFANRNHQADMLAIGLMLVISFLLDTWKKRRETGRFGIGVGMLVFIAVILVFALPLVGSRAGVIIAMVMLMGALLSAGLPTMMALRKSRALQIGSVLAAVMFAAGLQAAVAWMKADVAVEGSRHVLLTETLRIGAQHAPFGAGIGSFIPAFQQSASDALLTNTYINNAHNEYAQWWLEGGVLGVFVVAITLVLILYTLVSLLRQRQRSSSRDSGLAAMMGIGIIILHSMVDYPLRTQALMTVFSVLCGIAIAASSRRTSARIRQPADVKTNAEADLSRMTIESQAFSDSTQLS
jgi:O-antigen ligase